MIPETSESGKALLFSSPGVYAWDRRKQQFFLSPLEGASDPSSREAPWKGATSCTRSFHPGVNAWAREKEDAFVSVPKSHESSRLSCGPRAAGPNTLQRR